MKTIIYAHPWDGSYNHAILKTLTDALEAKQQAYQVIDLYQDGFNPVYSKEELHGFSQGKAFDPLVKSYQKQLQQTEELIFIFPIWWFGLPAIVKGFIDKVMLKGFAYSEDARGYLNGLLTHITKTTVITTATVDKAYLQKGGGSGIEGMFINQILAELGIKNDQTTWLHFPEVNLTTDANRKAFLASLPEAIV